RVAGVRHHATGAGFFQTGRTLARSHGGTGKVIRNMSNSNLITHDALSGASPGLLIRSPSTAALLPPLAELIGLVEARRLLESVGPPGVKHLGETELQRAAGLPSTLAKRVV